MSDYYDILGISKSATDEEIKTAYRKLAKIYHPDKGGDKNKFQEIQKAYETLSDSNKRNNYNNSSFQQQDNPHFPFEHPFFKYHNKNNIIKKNDYIHNCNISLNDVYTGINKKFRVQRNKICINCKQICQTCNGNGKIIQNQHFGPFIQKIEHNCSICNSTGLSKNNIECKICNNKKIIIEENIFEVNIKPGIESGTKITFPEWGEQPCRNNEIAGSFIVNIIINDHPDFQRNKLNLIWRPNISLHDSIIGKTLTIPYFIKPFELHTRGFGIINPQKEYVIHNRGLVDERGNQGNLHIKFIIEYPERNFNDEQINILQSAFDQVDFT
jgi:DnaJ family protein A protein 2